MRRCIQFVAALMVSAGFIQPQAVGQGTLPCRYEVTAIIPGPFCAGWGNAPVYARGLSNHDPPWVVGFYTQCSIGADKAFVWTGSGPVQTIPLPVWSGNPSSAAFGVNDHGWVVGSYYISNGWLGYIYDVPAGTLTPLHPGLPGGGCVARAVNNDGMVVGSRSPASTNSQANAFIWQNGVFTDLGFMNGPNSEARVILENGIVVGWTGIEAGGNATRGFLSANKVTTILPPLPGGISSFASAATYTSSVAGYGKIPWPSGGTRWRAILWNKNIPLNLGILDGFRNSGAFGVSDDARTVIGACWGLESGPAIDVACVWLDGAIFDLNALLVGAAPMHLTAALAINGRGQILCEASHQSGKVAVILTPVLAPVGDVTLDCIVNVNDLLGVINAWGQTGGPADLNQDGIVNHLDLLLVIQNWSFN
jgi:probable HAF family extracellular repeat protein